MYVPKLSVIVAVYNAEKYLKQCLDSIVNQTLKDIEIICINDGSQDNSLQILEEYAAKDSRFRIFTKENEGLGGASARNLGLDKAVGKYISILDSDDFFDLKMLEKAYNKAEQNDADLVVFGGCEYDERNGNTYKVGSILDDKCVPDKEVFSYKDCKDKIYQLTQGMAWNKLYRKNFLDKYNLKFQKIKYTDDAYFTFAHMVLAEKISVIKEPLCFYRVNTGISQTDGLANYPDSAYEPYLKLKASLEDWGIYEDVKQSFVNCTAAFLRYFYDKIGCFEPFEYLHNKYRDEIFERLDIKGQNEDYFYDKRVYMWCSHVIDNAAGEILLKTARAYGSENTTSILRFQFPYDKIPRDCRIVILGAGIIGRHFYSQIMLNGWCDIVLWAETENRNNLKYISKYEELENAKFDYAIIAYAQPHLINNAVEYIKNMGVSENKIIFGGSL